MKNYLITFFAFLLLPILNIQAQDQTVSTQPTGDSVLQVPVPFEMSIEQIQKIVLTTAAKRGWGTKLQEDGTVLAKLLHRNHDATLVFVITPKQITVYSDSYRIDKNGRRLKKDHPDGWIKNIDKDLKVNLVSMSPGL